MSTGYIDRTTAVIGRIEGLELVPHAARLLANGEPIELEQLAAASGWTVEAVDVALDERTSAERDDHGRLVGLGLTLRPTPHRFTFDGRTVYAWCATDALIFPIILGRPGTIESTCPETRRVIRIELTPDTVEGVDPAEAIMSAVRPVDLSDVRSAVCHHGRFFSSPAAAMRWADEHPDGHVYRVADAFALDREVMKRLGWDAPVREAMTSTDRRSSHDD